MACLSDDTVLAFVEGRLSGDALADVDQHLAACADCRTVAAATLQFFAETRSRGSSIPGGTHEPLTAGTRVARYAIRAPLGAGGAGVVYRAHDPELDREVAIKLLRRRVDGEASSLTDADLLREAQAMARLAHANVVRVYDAGTFLGQVYLAMEHVDGGTLATWLGDPHPWRAVLAAFAQAGQGLAAAHRAGIVHGDFKPDNVVVSTDGRVLVTDFGLARRRGEDPTGQDSPRGGTPLYMSPEQMRSGRGDERADQFSFCVALYRALYGRHPFGTLDKGGPTLLTLASRLATAEPEPPPRGSGVPAKIGRALLRGLRPRSDDRYASMDDLLADLALPATGRWGRLTALALGPLAVAMIVWRLFAAPSAVCGNKKVETGEQCDDGNTSDADGCLSTCQRAACGDGILRVQVEECDDGNDREGDGCSKTCMRCAEGDFSTYWHDLGHCYWRDTDRRENWTDANLACRVNGGSLVTYNRPAENRAVRDGLSLKPDADFWIGLSRNPGGAFLSVTTGITPTEALPWAAGEPRADGGACVYDDVAGAGLRTANCDERLPFVCERPGWVIRPEDNHAYRFFPISVDWDTANAACTRLGAHLATIQDPGEQFFVFRYVYSGAWLGGNDRAREGRFQWTTGERFEIIAVRHRGWNDRDGTEDCVLFGSDNFWDDRPCSESHTYVCEKE